MQDGRHVCQWIMSSPAEGIDRREALRRTALLFGGILSAPTVAAVFAACDARAATERAGPLSGEQRALIDAIAEQIIPETETPGARGAGVPRFIETMLAEYYSTDQRTHFLAGLADVDARSRRVHGKRFVDCSRREQHDVLAALDREAYHDGAASAAKDGRSDDRGRTENATADQRSGDSTRAKARGSHTPFFRMMKELTLLGYYTSQVGATRELRYAQVPGRFEGCVPFAKIGRAWAV